MAFEKEHCRNTNHETETWSCRLEGKNSGGALLAWSPYSPTTYPSTPWWRGSSPPLDYGFVEVTYVSLLSHVLHYLVPCELPNIITVIYVIPMWWIFLRVDMCMRLQWFCLSYESRCILCTPFFSTCFDQACLWERMWGNMCISWSNGGWLVWWTWEKVPRST